ncbi:hypothetical protein BST61_g32 [Cercospora zeina]
MTGSDLAERAPIQPLGAHGLEHGQDIGVENTAQVFSHAEDSDAESDKKSERPKSSEAAAAKDIDAIVTANKLPQQPDEKPSPFPPGTTTSSLPPATPPTSPPSTAASSHNSESPSTSPSSSAKSPATSSPGSATKSSKQTPSSNAFPASQCW